MLDWAQHKAFRLNDLLLFCGVFFAGGGAKECVPVKRRDWEAPGGEEHVAGDHWRSEADYGADWAQGEYSTRPLIFSYVADALIFSHSRFLEPILPAACADHGQVKNLALGDVTAAGPPQICAALDLRQKFTGIEKYTLLDFVIVLKYTMAKDMWTPEPRTQMRTP